MTTSKHLITALEKSDWMDRMLIFAGLIFFVLVVLFILKQRLVDRGLRIALWWTRFIPDFSGDKALLAMEKGEGSLTATASEVISTVSTLLATVAASLASSSISPNSSSLPHIDADNLTNLSDVLRTTASDPSILLDQEVTGASSSVLADATPGSGSHDEL